MHVHQLVSNAGVATLRYSAADYDRLWLHKQRLIDSERSVAYVGYTPNSEVQASLFDNVTSVVYVGYAFEDTSQCAACRSEQ